MATKMNEIASHRGTKPNRGKTIQGIVLVATSANDNERATTKGTTSVMAYARLGDITTDQFRALAQIQRDFQLDIRVTNRQNFAMRDATNAGRNAYLAGRMPKKLYASASSPLAGVVR